MSREELDSGVPASDFAPENLFSKPVVLFMFNRPEMAIEVFEEIRKIQPSQLFLICDGPRRNVLGEERLVDECRKLSELVTWDCKVHQKYSAENLGCKVSVSSGLDWVFSLVEEAIILEDDCLPSQDFFWYAAELLDKYKQDKAVGSISGSNLDGSQPTNREDSYYFSNFPGVWGWATWRRAWNGYKANLASSSRSEIRLVNEIVNATSSSRRFWFAKLMQVRAGFVDTWDYQLVFHHWKNRMLTIIPRVNLISNIGFGLQATHTISKVSPYARMSVQEIGFPLKHPENLVACLDQDAVATSARFSMTRAELVLDWAYILLPQSIRRLAQKLTARDKAAF